MATHSGVQNPRDSGACWAPVYGVAQSWTRLKRLSSSSSSMKTVLGNLRVMCLQHVYMLFMTIIGTIIIAVGTLGLLFPQNASVNYSDAFKLIITPNLVLNLLFSIPIYAFLNDVVNTIYIGEEGE